IRFDLLAEQALFDWRIGYQEASARIHDQTAQIRDRREEGRVRYNRVPGSAQGVREDPAVLRAHPQALALSIQAQITGAAAHAQKVGRVSREPTFASCQNDDAVRDGRVQSSVVGCDGHATNPLRELPLRANWPERTLVVDETADQGRTARVQEAAIAAHRQ